MTHMAPISDSQGDFSDEKPCDRKCHKCGGPMTYRVWESSCGGYEDVKYSCVDTKCGGQAWIDGCDS